MYITYPHISIAAEATHTLTKGWSASDYKAYIKINVLCKQSVRVTGKKCILSQKQFTARYVKNLLLKIPGSVGDGESSNFLTTSEKAIY